MPNITLPWSTDDFQIHGRKVGTLYIDASKNMTFTDLNGNSQGPYATSLNTNGGSLGHTSVCNADGCLTINNITYDIMTGELTGPGRGGGNLHVKGTPVIGAENGWTAVETMPKDTRAKHHTSRS